MLQEQIDRVMPGWTVVCKLGEGSYGGVYQLTRTLPNGKQENAALKKLSVPRNNEEIRVLQAQSFSAERISAYFKSQVKKLVNEYLFMQQLSAYPNVVSCQDIQYCGRADGIGWDIYIRMELLTPLKKTVTGEYNEYQVLRLGLNMCRALQACEARNIIHRDIKPENILVSDRGSYKLGDFGIAKVSEKTESGTLAGTNGYMAPEVANRQRYGREVDIYSLGLVLYWMMNENTLPFLPLPPQIPSSEQREAAVTQRLSGTPLPPPVNGSPALKRAVLHACAFDPAQRYRSANEFGAVLLYIRKNKKATSSDEILQELGMTREMLTAAPEHRPERIQEKPQKTEDKVEKHPGRKKWVALLGTAMLLCLLGCGALLAFRSGNAPEPLPTMSTMEQMETEPPAEETLPPTQPPQYSVSSDEDGVVLTQWLDTAAEEIYVPGEVDGCLVTAIGVEAFSGCVAVKQVFLPDGITAIGESAFAGCKQLEEIRFPESLVTVGDAAFRGCAALSAVEIPGGVRSLGAEAFSGCGSLTGIDLPETLERIGEYAFQNCGSLLGADIPESVREIGNGAFSDSGLLHVTLHIRFTGQEKAFLPQDCEITYVGYERVAITGEVGDTFTFGRYEQDNNLDNGMEPIEWKILEKDGTKILAISLYGLDSQRYHDKWEIVTWETCKLRQWLNQTFYATAFNPLEQTMILTSDVYSVSPARTYPSRMVQDKIFLLDYDGAYQYFKSERARTCYATDYAAANGSTVQGQSHYCWWWLREGYFVDLASIPNAQRVNFTDYGGTVRPIMWIDTANQEGTQ